MARARKNKARSTRKRTAKLNKSLAKQSQTNWTIGAGALAVALMLGAAIYAVTMNEGTRTSVASFVEKFELPQSVKELPETLKQNLPELPANNSGADTGKSETAPAQ